MTNATATDLVRAIRESAFIAQGAYPTDRAQRVDTFVAHLSGMLRGSIIREQVLSELVFSLLEDTPPAPSATGA